MSRITQFDSLRRFGVEFELNTTSGEVKELADGESPEGSAEIAQIIAETTRSPVEIHPWHHTHDNEGWIVKPDRSCGIELCSPVFKGWAGIQTVMRVADALAAAGVVADDRCSLHLHISVQDLSLYQMGSIVAHYIKCEPTFMEAMPRNRRANRYCQCIGTSDFLDHSIVPSPAILLQRVSMTKYHSLNAYHMRKARRSTLEARLGDHTMCLDSYSIKNWIRLMLHFVEVSRELGMPPRHRYGNKFTGLAWIDPIDVMKLLGFDGDRLSPGMKQVRRWFVDRLFAEAADDQPPGLWSGRARGHALEPLRQYLREEIERDSYGRKYAM